MTDEAIATETTTTVSAVELIQQPSWDIAHLREVRHVVFSDRNEFDLLRSWTYEQADGDLRQSLAQWVLGSYEDCIPTFESHRDQPHIKALLAYSYTGQGEIDQALQLVESPQNVEEAGARAQAMIRLAGGKVEAIESLLASPGQLENTAWMPFLEGWKAEQELRIDDAIRFYTKSREMDPDLADAVFHLARLLELKGDDEEALEIYEDYLKRMPANPSLLINLGVLYEDSGEYPQAEACFRAVLNADPTNKRAKLFLNDVQASMNMLYDEDQERREDKRNAILRTPVTDFELSVRSRNCLAKMGIRTLGDLVQKTEAELLSYKNFGETSLMEIQQILNSKGLRLGMDQDELTQGSFGAPRLANADMSDPRNRPISELELSVRSRRVVEMFKLRVIGDLCSKTEAELMACPNFGQTSLNEIKSKLDEFGLALKG